MGRISLTPDEIGQIDRLLAEIASQVESAEDAALLTDAPVYAAELPRRVRKFLSDFKHLEPADGICVVSGYPVDQTRIGRTPHHWKARAKYSPALREELLLVLFGSLLGEHLGWATQQNGHIVHDVMPIREHETSQLGSNSQELLWWHTEDAFHPYRGDYIGLMCLRNDDRVPTTVACIDKIAAEVKQAQVLFEPHYRIRPDESHQQANSVAAGAAGAGSVWPAAPPVDERQLAAYKRIEELDRSGEPLAVLFGDREHPYVRLDPYFMHGLDEPGEPYVALRALTDAIEENLTECVLEAGDILFIDNYRTVHGRKPFKARYDGTDRWLKRINITRDLRKSREQRRARTSRVIY